jgi:hypothetical protein
MIEQIYEMEGVHTQIVDEISRDYSIVDPSFTSQDMPSFLKPDNYTRTMSISELLEQSKTPH